LSHYYYVMSSPTTEIYTLSLHDALPIYLHRHPLGRPQDQAGEAVLRGGDPDRQGDLRAGGGVRREGVQRRDREEDAAGHHRHQRSEEHTSELQSPDHLVCRLLLEKKKNI